MKKSIVLLAISAAAFVGCEQRETDEAAGAQREQAEQSLEASKEQIDAQKEQIESQAKAEKEQIEAQADAQKAQLEAEQKQLEASAEAQKAQADAQEAQAQAQQDAQEAQAEAQQEQAQAQQDAQEAQAEAQQAQADSQQQIQESAGAAAGDKELETRVRTTLMGDAAQPTTGTQNVQITVKEGKVTLNGTVQSEEQKNQLEQQAKGIQGVKSVENNLKVQGQ